MIVEISTMLTHSGFPVLQRDRVSNRDAQADK